ncbi:MULTISPECIES: ADP-ribosyltransferase [Bacillus cereus group]|uniref:ADP-ribosyltransferase n=1 Tax=Bacillus cereus group TaxID=86661 RepID=UPI001483BD50|nr:ADP-ribosyltransferase [Bacillus cereus]HDR8028852.1 hypothetical protein [Bacillus cereus]HDR8428341.1 hypothetical protein [Bacillus cereus]HDR8446477.1 hypothetical protein [Bacillus cereus]
MFKNQVLKSLSLIIIAIYALMSIGTITMLATEVDINTTQSTNSTDLEAYGVEWLTTLNTNEKSAITYYTGQNYVYINQYLRNKRQEIPSGSTISKLELEDKIRLIDSAINKAILKEDIMVYRNTGEQEFNEAKYFFATDMGA